MGMLLRRYHKVDVEPTADYHDMKVDELRELAKDKHVEGYAKMKKEELIEVLTEK